MHVKTHDQFADIATFSGPRKLCDIEFRECDFLHCWVAVASRPADRFILRNVRLADCTFRDCSISTARIENVLVESVRKAGRQPFFTWVCVFKNVTLRGPIVGSMILNRVVDPMRDDKTQQVWDADAAAYYRDCDWTLDISKAEFSAIDIRCVPGHMIIRDSEAQVVVNRDKAAASDFRKLGVGPYQIGISQFLSDSPFDSTVLIAPRKSKSFKQHVESLELLRREGIAESD